MANKARWVFGVFRNHEVITVQTVTAVVGADRYTPTERQTEVPIGFLPRQDLRRAAAAVGASGDASRTNDQLVADILAAAGTTTWSDPRVKVPYGAARWVKATPTTSEPTVPTTPTSDPTTSEPASLGALDEVIRSIVRHEVASAASSWRSPLDEGRVQELIEDGLKALRPIVRNVTVNGATVASVQGRRHFQYEDILTHVLAGDELYLWGGAGAGKTTTVQQIAEDLGKRFELVTFSSQTTEAKLVGFRDASGEVRVTPLVDALQEPSVVLFDEWDSCPPSVALTVNAVSANRMISTPAGTFKVHPECVLVFSGNTSLDGATAAYNGRAAADFSSKDRLSVVEFLYDLEMEAELTVAALGGDHGAAERWLRVVRGVRKNVLAMGPTTSARIAITPRAAYGGAKLLRTGRFDLKYVANARLRKGMDDRTWDQARAGIPELA